MSTSSRAQLLRLLRKVDVAELRRATRGHSLRELRELSSGLGQEVPEKEFLAQSVLGLHNEGILGVAAIRRGLLRVLPEAQLRALARKFLPKELPRVYDNALALASMRWRVGSKWAEAFVDTFDLSYEYLPTAGSSQPTVDTVEPFRPAGQLFEYQAATVAEVVSQLRPGARVLVQMPTGAGKTRVLGEALLSYLQEKDLLDSGRGVLWLAHSGELCEQAVDSFATLWRTKGSSALRVVRLWGSRSASTPAIRGSFVAVTLQRLHAMSTRRSDFFGELRRSAALVVVDEAHKAVAPTYKAAIEAVLRRDAILLGLTATPGRALDSDVENRKLVAMFERNLVRPPLGEKMVAALQDLGVLARLQRTTIETGICIDVDAEEEQELDRGEEFREATLERLARDQGRNRLIVKAIEDQVSMGRPTIAFACTRSHAVLLSTTLNVRGVAARYVGSDTNKHLRWDYIRDYRDGDVRVLVNYGILTTGFDAPNTRTVLIARPTNSVVLYGQMIGRALRGPRVGGAEESYLVDVRDNFSRFGSMDRVLSTFDEFWT